MITADQVAACREPTANPLTVIDFNMFGSTTGLESLDGVGLFSAAALEVHVKAYADEMCSTHKFNRAVQAAERYIDRCVAIARSRPSEDHPTDDNQRVSLRCAGADVAAKESVAS